MKYNFFILLILVNTNLLIFAQTENTLMHMVESANKCDFVAEYDTYDTMVKMNIDFEKTDIAAFIFENYILDKTTSPLEYNIEAYYINDSLRKIKLYFEDNIAKYLNGMELLLNSDKDYFYCELISNDDNLINTYPIMIDRCSKNIIHLKSNICEEGYVKSKYLFDSSNKYCNEELIEFLYLNYNLLPKFRLTSVNNYILKYSEIFYLTTGTREYNYIFVINDSLINNYAILNISKINNSYCNSNKNYTYPWRKFGLVEYQISNIFYKTGNNVYDYRY